VYTDNLIYEKKLLEQGIEFIAGIDEVGRGCIAGPFVACAAILDIKKILELFDTNNDVSVATKMDLEMYKNIKDSKLISEKKRNKLSQLLITKVISYSIIEISHYELDQIGMTQATQKAFYAAVKQLGTTPQHILTDAFAIHKIPPTIQTNIVKGDQKSITIAAASNLAKVHRDNKMIGLHKNYPEYGFDKNKGYGTKFHIAMLEKYGPCPIHRMSFEPLKSKHLF
jgi:ribonuclease HII